VNSPASPTYMEGADPAAGLADYYPAWLDKLADDVTVEGSLLNGAVQALAVVVQSRGDRVVAPLWGLPDGAATDYGSSTTAAPPAPLSACASPSAALASG
jgi:hypothetical protein